jgi:SecD/SecF fusion protein
MLENARRQFILVLLVLAGALACMVALHPTLGPDLRGGTQLHYDVPKDFLDQLVQKEGMSQAAIMEQTIGVIAERVDPSGTLDVLVVPAGDTGILIELPYMQDVELGRVLDRIANLGKLEMRIVADGDYVNGSVRFNMQMEKQRLETWLQQPGNKEALLDDHRNIRLFNEDQAVGPAAFQKLKWYPRLIGPNPEDSSRWDAPYSMIPSLQGSTVKVYDEAADFNGGVIPPALAAKEPKKRVLLELIALNMDERFFTGEDLDPAGVSPGTDRHGRLAVHYKIVDAKGEDYAKWSEDYINKASAIVLNGVVKSAPTFEGRIPGRGIITGDFSKPEVEELVKVLRTGSLRIEPELLSKQVIGPTLGADAIQAGLFSLIAGAGFVFVATLWYYRMAGVVACIALALNVVLLYAGMLFMQATITLPGLSGIVLTLGMAVDANVLIYERIREELARGKDLLRSVRAGFERAMSAILDSNITTFLAGLVLYSVGIGPVRGFAVTLMLGIVTTVFTQVFVTRLIFHWLLESKRLTQFNPRQLIRTPNVDWVRFIKPACIGSGLFLATGVCYAMFAVPREVMLGMDFTGGANLRMVLAEATTVDSVRRSIEGDQAFDSAYPHVTVNTVGEPDAQERFSQFNVRLKLNDTQRGEIDQERARHREARRAAEKAQQPPPPDFEQHYVRELRRIFGERLVKPAFSEPGLVPLPGPASAQQFAQINLHFQKPVAVQAAIEQMRGFKLRDASAKVIGAAGASEGRDLLVEWTTDSTTQSWQLFDTAKQALEGLLATDGIEVTLSSPFPEAQEIQGRLVGDLRNAAIAALILSWVMIVLYLRVRFHEYKYGFAAVVALVHDVLFTFVVVVVANHWGIVHAEINLAMIAAFLTIIGYSVNDTIVIFDRIRENVNESARLGTRELFRDLINRSLNQTMARTILTSSLTSLVVVAQMLVNWGSESDLESFAFAMLAGMFTGVYSTIFIAAPMLIVLRHESTIAPAPPPDAAEPAPVEAAAP